MVQRILIAGLIAAIPASLAMAQQHSSFQPLTLVNEPEAVIQWGGQTWRIPQRFFVVWHQPEELRIQIGWIKKTNTVIPASIRGYDMSLDIQVRKDNNEDAKNGLATLRRTGATFTKLPQLASAQLPGLTYLATGEGSHYFVMTNRDAYVECRSIPVKAIISPYVADEPLMCETTFHLPNGLYAWVQTSQIKLADAKPGFDVAYDALISFMNN